MDLTDQKLIFEAEKGLLLTPHPFTQIATTLGITPQEVIKRLQKLKEQGVIRRFGVSLRPNDVGYNANGLVAWKVPQGRIQEIGIYLAGYKDISHCYERGTVAGKWEYNLYTVIHAHKREAIEQLVKLLSSLTGLKDYVIIYSTRNLKTKHEETKKC